MTEPTKPQSEYLFVEIAAQRCTQLMRGAKPKLDTNARKYTSLAVDEVEASTVPWTLEARDPEVLESEEATAGLSTVDSDQAESTEAAEGE